MKLKKIRGINEYYLSQQVNVDKTLVYLTHGFYKQIIFENNDILWFKDDQLLIHEGTVNTLNSMI